MNLEAASIIETEGVAKRLSPILKWAGGKEQELKYILPKLPESFENYYEPFIGGGAVYMAVKACKYFINDKSDELIRLYRSICEQNQNLFFRAINEVIHNWDLLTDVVKNNQSFFLESYKEYSQDKLNDEKMKQKMFQFIVDHSEQFNGMFSPIFNFNTPNFIRELQVNMIRKIKRMKQLEKQKDILPDTDILDNIETSLKSAFYMHFRHIYNNVTKYKISEAVKSSIFIFIRNFAYSGMFRYNSSGQFNVPYGGIGYNRKNFKKKIDYLQSEGLQRHLKQTTIENLDFQDFFRLHTPSNQDFIFLDPPYDSEFSTYAKNEFNREDQSRLADYLINDCKAKWMLVIKSTDFIKGLYFDKNLNITTFGKTYLVSFMNRNDKNTEHLLITNY
jgi:DNA adenine methylase